MLQVVGQGNLDVTWAPTEPCGPNDVCAALTGGSIVLTQVHNAKYSGPINLRVRVGDAVSEPVHLIVSTWEKGTVRLLVAGIILGILVVLGLLFRYRFSKSYKVLDQSYSLWATLFIDKETDTYSLSKLQFYLWTLVALVGYVYAFLGHCLVQGQLALVDVPSGLSGLLAISASTAAMATGIHTIRGAKGAGPVQPSFGDFLTTGGIVAPERLQLLVWTFVGCAGFLFVVVATDPGNVQGLPQVPDGLLLLMGVSSFGYVGGKVARNPGPILTRSRTPRQRGRSTSKAQT